MFVGIDADALIIWLRSEACFERVIPAANLFTLTARTCAFSQTKSFLKSLTPNDDAGRTISEHHLLSGTISPYATG